MVAIHYDKSGMGVLVTDLPEINGEGWRKRKAEGNRLLHIRRLHDELCEAQAIWDRGPKTAKGRIYKIALDIPEGSFWERWLAIANACFAPILAQADANYWIKRDQYVDWWQLARLSQGSQRDAERAAESWFAGAMGAGG